MHKMLLLVTVTTGYSMINLPSLLLHSIMGYIHLAHGHMENLSPQAKEFEANWFMKVAWNTGLQAEDAYHEMSEALKHAKR